MVLPLLALVVMQAAGPAEAANATVDVGSGGNNFVPAAAQINVGESVTWHWVGGNHGVAADDGDVVWCSSRSGGPDCSRTFSTVGFVRYHCTVHGSNMAGTVEVVYPTAPGGGTISARSATSADNGDGGGPSLTLNKPSGTVQYDVMLAQVTVRGGTATSITAPSGWTLVLRTDDSNNLGQAIYRKAAGASEASSYAWNFSPDDRASGGIIAYAGVDNANPVDVSGGQANGASTSVTAPAVTTTVDNAMLVGFFGIRIGTAIAPPSGMTERYDEPNSNRVSSEAADEVRASAGSTGTRVASATVSERNIGQLVALRPPSLSFASASSSGSESTTSVSLTVTRSGATSGDSSADYAVTGGTASGGGVDYTLTSGTVTLNAGETSKTIAVTVVNDALDENDETVTVTLSNPTYANLGSTTGHTYTITDDDSPPSVAYSAASSSGSEGTTPANLAVILSAASGKTVTVDYAVTGGTATGSGTDYTLASGTLTFNPGETSKNVAVTVVNDALDESDETMVVTLSNPGNAALGSTTSHTYTLQDDDAAPTVTLGLAGSPMAEAAGSATVTATLSAASGLDVTVDLAFSGTATLTDDYTRSGTSIVIAAGGTSGTVTLTAVQDALDEAAETVVVDISSVTNGAESGTQQVTASITDDDPTPTVTLSLSGSPAAEASGVATVTATLSAASGQDVTVDLAFTGTATLTSDYTRSGTSIVMLAGATTGTVTLTAVQDALDENDETVIVDVSGVTNGLESGTQQATATITDDDAAPTVTLGLSGSPMAEAAEVATVTATLSAASGLDVTVNLAFSGTATLTSDYTRSGTSIVIPAGSTTGTITLTAAQDAIDEPDESVLVDIDTVTNGAESGSQQVTAIVADDDAAPTVTLSLTGSPLAEAGGAGTVTATLSAASGQTVTVNLAFTGTATFTTDYTRTGTSILIATGGTTGTITLTAVQDALDENDETVVVDIDSVANGAESGTQQVTASVADDDATPTVTLALTGSPMAEAAGVATVTATLSAASGLDVTVNLAFTGTATLTNDYSRSGTSIVIAAGSTTGTVTLTAVQDALDEADETVIVDVDTVTNGAESGSQQVTATITDDDAPPTVTLSLTGSPMAEAAGTATVMATLSAASSFDVTVNLAFSGNATLTADYARSGTTILIAAGSTTGSVTITAADDTTDEPNEGIVVDVDSVTNGNEAGAQQVTATITDDDAPPAGGGGGGGSAGPPTGSAFPTGFDGTALLSFTALFGDDGASLTWNAHASSDVKGYLVWTDNGAWTVADDLPVDFWRPASGYSFDDGDAAVGTKYKLTFYTGPTPTYGYATPGTAAEELVGWDGSVYLVANYAQTPAPPDAVISPPEASAAPPSEPTQGEPGGAGGDESRAFPTRLMGVSALAATALVTLQLVARSAWGAPTPGPESRRSRAVLARAALRARTHRFETVEWSEVLTATAPVMPPPALPGSPSAMIPSPASRYAPLVWDDLHAQLNIVRVGTRPAAPDQTARSRDPSGDRKP